MLLSQSFKWYLLKQPIKGNFNNKIIKSCLSIFILITFVKNVNIKIFTNVFSQATISKWVKGELSPKVKSVEPLAKALGITVGDLIGDFGNNIKLSDDDKRLLSLSPKQKKLLLSLLDTLIENGLPSKFLNSKPFQNPLIPSFLPELKQGKKGTIEVNPELIF